MESKKMKKIMISLLLALFMSACATTQKYPLVTTANVKKNCEASESWRVPVMGLANHVVRFEECLSVKPLLIIATDTETYAEDINRATIDLLALHYVAYLDKTNKNKAHSIKKLKEEQGKDGWLVTFYTVTVKTKE